MSVLKTLSKAEKKTTSLKRPFLLRYLPLFLGLIILLGALILFYFQTWEAPSSRFLKQSTSEFSIFSLESIFQNYLGQETGDLILSEPEYLPFKAYLSVLRRAPFWKDFPISLLMDSPGTVSLSVTGKALVVVDLGAWSLFSRTLPFLTLMYNFPELEKVEATNRTQFLLSFENTKTWVYFENNLAYITNDASTIESVSSLSREEASQTASLYENFPPKANTVQFHVNPQWILSELSGSSPDIYQIPPALTLDTSATMTLELGPLMNHAKLDFALAKPLIPEFLDISRSSQKIWNLLPENTSFALVSSGLPLNSLLSLTPLKALIPGQLNPILPWMGLEMGMITLGTDPDPILFTSVVQETEAQSFLSPFRTNKDANFQTGPVSLTLPEQWQEPLKIVTLGNKQIFILFMDNFMFLGPDKNSLARISAEKTKKISTTKEFQSLSNNTTPQGTFSILYNLDRVTPGFLSSKHLLSRLFKLYLRGLLQIQPEGDHWTMELTGLRTRASQVRTLPGFPKDLGEPLKSPLEIVRFEGKDRPLGVFLQGDNLVFWDPLTDEKTVSSIGTVEKIIPAEGLGGVFTYQDSGVVNFYTSSGESAPGFPITTEFKKSYTPFIQDKALVLWTPDARSASVSLGGSVYKNTNTPPLPVDLTTRFGLWAYRSFKNTALVYLTNIEGQTQKGWPQTLSESSIAPILFKSAGHPAVALLSESGKLLVKDYLGDTLIGYPIDLPGPFIMAPVVIHGASGTEKLLLLNEDGVLYLVDPQSPKVEQTKRIMDIPPRTLLKIQDVNHDGEEEIFLYGSGTTILGLDSHLNPLPSFPLRGSSEPQFFDLDNDGFMELITRGEDTRVYAYSMRF